MIFDGTDIPHFPTVIITEIFLRAPFRQVSLNQLAQDGHLLFPSRAVSGACDRKTLRGVELDVDAYFFQIHAPHLPRYDTGEYTRYRVFAQAR